MGLFCTSRKALGCYWGCGVLAYPRPLIRDGKSLATRTVWEGQAVDFLIPLCLGFTMLDGHVQGSLRPRAVPVTRKGFTPTGGRGYFV